MWSYSSSTKIGDWNLYKLPKIFPKDKSWVSSNPTFLYEAQALLCSLYSNAFVDKLPCLLHSDYPFSFRTISYLTLALGSICRPTSYENVGTLQTLSQESLFIKRVSPVKIVPCQKVCRKCRISNEDSIAKKEVNIIYFKRRWCHARTKMEKPSDRSRFCILYQKAWMLYW